VTHAIRGEDHLTNTPRQILILQALGLPVPIYGHIALIVGPDGSPLSKRHGSKSAVELREQGYLPNAVNNYLARLGHYYGHDHYLSLEELAAQFKVESLVKSPAKFNLEQLNFWQKMALEPLSPEAVLEWLGDVQAKIPSDQALEFIELIKPNILFPKDALHWVTIIYGQAISYGDEELATLQAAGSDYFRVAVAAYEQFPNDFSGMMNHIKTALNVKGKGLFMPLRIALTGEQHGPELEKLLHFLGPKEVRRRLETAL
jgi:glutamyl/glutaminyl-tRNA synthetase